MAKRDFKKLLADLYGPSHKQPSLVTVPEMNFVMVDGWGDPETSERFQDATEALYAVSFTLKFAAKGLGAEHDYVVPPLEGLWWTEDDESFDMADRGAWLWTLMIMQPEPVDEEMFIDAAAQLQESKDLPALPGLRFEPYDEGRAAQIMHIGPYDQEPETIARLHAFIADRGHELRGNHHEIYLSDPRRTAAEKLKTVLRQPVQ